MRSLVKWMDNDPVFDSLGGLIIALGFVALGSLLAYIAGTPAGPMQFTRRTLRMGQYLLFSHASGWSAMYISPRYHR